MNLATPPPPTRNEAAANVRPVTSHACPRCGAMNLSDRKFCAGCGAAVWEPCLGCGADNLAGEKFCGQCGVDLAAEAKTALEKLEQAEMLAQTHLLAHRYGQAIAVLQRVSQRPHPHLTEAQQRIAELSAEIRRELAGKEVSRTRTLEQAQARVVARDYDTAFTLLSGIPIDLQTVEIAELLAEVEAKRREIAELTAEIRERMAAKKHEGLLTRVDRLLELQPDLAPVRTLRQKLHQLEEGENERRRGTFVEAATKKLNAFQYQEALQLLEQVAPGARTPQVEKMLEFAREAACLDSDLREVIRLDEHVLPLARRLQKLRPEDPCVKRLIEELEQPAQAAASGPLAAIRQRQAKPQVARLFGCQLAALSSFQRIELSPEVAASPVFREHDGNWGVAAGLALQALGQSAIRVNLKPEDKNLVRKLLTSSLIKKTARVAWGIDLGRSALKAVRLSWNAEVNKAVCEAVDWVEYESPLSSPGASPEKLLSEAVQAFVARHKFKETPLALGLDGREVFTRFLKTPPVAKDRLDDLVQYEARNQIPYDLNQFSWGYTVQERPDQPAEDFGEYSVAILAAKRAQLDLRLGIFQQLKLTVDIVQCDAVALHNFLLHERGNLLSPAGDELFLTLDLGAETANFIVSRPGSFFWMRNMPLGGADFTKSLIREAKLTFAQAETQKRAPATAPRVHKMYQALDPVTEQLITQTQHSLRAFENLHPGRKFARAWLHGDSFRLHGLHERLAR